MARGRRSCTAQVGHEFGIPMISNDLLAILVCPSCKKKVEPKDAAAGDNAQMWLVCTGCGLRFPVRDDIPIMLVEEAAPAKA